ncbi:hypothetical protein BC943DRAFT_381385 [Umbelopsis sp. AD052]|nr:hypothetical protein BC943DRAFT_381385 [Umbelopsis sp. AD052]
MHRSANHLPHELLISIFLQLGRKDQFNCMFVNQSWYHVVCSYIIYPHISLLRENDMARFMTLLEQTALNRQDPNRQSFYSRTDYGSLIKRLDLPWTKQSQIQLSASKLRRLVIRCRNIEAISLNDHWNLSDEQLIEVFRHCPRIMHLNLSGAFYTTINAFLHKDTKHVCHQIKSLDVRHTLDFWASKRDAWLPSLLDLRVDVGREDDFIRLQKILLHCKDTLRTLVINVKSTDHGHGFAYLNHALIEMENLNKLAISFIGRPRVTTTFELGAQMHDFEISGHCPPDVLSSLLSTTHLKRLVLWNCRISHHDINAIVYKNRATLETFFHTDRSVPSPQFADIKTPIDLSVSSNLKCVLVTVSNHPSTGTWLCDTYRHQLEHLYIAWNGDDEPSTTNWFSRLAAAPWPKVKSIILSNKIRLSEAEAYRFLDIFENLEYIYFLLTETENLEGKFLVQLMQLPYLKGAGGFSSQMLPADTLSRSFTQRLEYLEIAYKEWAKGSQLLGNNEYPIQSSFYALPGNLN